MLEIYAYKTGSDAANNLAHFSQSITKQKGATKQNETQWLQVKLQPQDTEMMAATVKNVNHLKAAVITLATTIHGMERVVVENGIKLDNQDAGRQEQNRLLEEITSRKIAIIENNVPQTKRLMKRKALRIIDADKTTPVQEPKIKKRRKLRQLVPPTPGTMNSSEEEEEEYRNSKTALCVFCGKYFETHERLTYHLKYKCPLHPETNVKRNGLIDKSSDDEEDGYENHQAATV